MKIDLSSMAPSKEEAIKRGEDRFFPGKPCGNGHVSFIYVSNNDCYECTRARKKARKERISLAQKMYEYARDRSRRFNIPFNITVQDVEDVIPADMMCPYLGILMIENCKFHNNKPSIDKIIPRFGYVVGNILVVSMMANSTKKDIDDPLFYLRIHNKLLETRHTLQQLYGDSPPKATA